MGRIAMEISSCKMCAIVLWTVMLTIINSALGYHSMVETRNYPTYLNYPDTVSGLLGDKATRQIQDWAASHPQSASGMVRDDQGCPVPSLTATLAVGQRGQAMLHDVFLLNKLSAFARERIPERVVHAKGHGAFGYFRLDRDISTLTKADLFNGAGKITKVLIRFSTVGGISGTSDLEREGRGFAVKFYTNDGIFDLVGNFAGTFPIRDPILFGDLNRSRKINPVTRISDKTMRWDFGSYRPESIMHTLRTFSDFGSNSRVISGFGVHAFKFVNQAGHPVFVKFHMLSEQPYRWYNSTELELVSGMDPDHSTRDLYNAIANKNYPKWSFHVQIMTAEQAANYPVNPFDATKVWRPEEFPLMRIGELVLNENPTDVFNDIEQAAFSPERMVPGIEPSPDRLLIGRMFSYPDAQRYRLGTNFAQLEVNRPKLDMKNYIRDGFMKDNPNGAGGPNYFPNSFHGPTANTSNMASEFHVRGIVDRFDTSNDVEDNFRLARLYLYKDLTAAHRGRVAGNIGRSLAKAIKEVRERAARNLFFRVTPEFGKQVWEEMEKAVENAESGDE